MKVLFLDIDGVLNSHDFDPEAMCGPIHRDKVARLNRVLKATGAYIVLSSAWRYIVHRRECDIRGMEWLLRSHGLIAGRLLGITRPDEMMPKVWNGDITVWPVENERGRQISDWLQSHIHLTYAVVDDMDLGITEAGHRLVKTDGAAGMTDKDADELIRLLG
jgi:hypothetical protein